MRSCRRAHRQIPDDRGSCTSATDAPYASARPRAHPRAREGVTRRGRLLRTAAHWVLFIIAPPPPIFRAIRSHDKAAPSSKRPPYSAWIQWSGARVSDALECVRAAAVLTTLPPYDARPDQPPSPAGRPPAPTPSSPAQTLTIDVGLAESGGLGGGLESSSSRVRGSAGSASSLVADGSLFTGSSVTALSGRGGVGGGGGGGGGVTPIVLAEIRRDLGRSFHAHRFFAQGGADSEVVIGAGTGLGGGASGDSTRAWAHVTEKSAPGLCMLQHVLVGFALARPAVAYCQGMNYVAAMLLLLAAPCDHGGGRFLRKKRGAVGKGAVAGVGAVAHARGTASSTAVTRRDTAESGGAEVLPASTGGGVIGWISSFFGFSSPRADSISASLSPAVPGGGSAAPARQKPRAARVLAYDITRTSRALALLLALADSLGLADVWRPGVPRLRLLGFTLSELVRRELPVLHEHLGRLGVDWDNLASQWLLPLGATLLPPCTLARVWDALFAQASWKPLLRVCVALLSVSSTGFRVLSRSALPRDYSPVVQCNYMRITSFARYS